MHSREARWRRSWARCSTWYAVMRFSMACVVVFGSLFVSTIFVFGFYSIFAYGLKVVGVYSKSLVYDLKLFGFYSESFGL